MPALYPLRFEPIFRRYIWGGRRLATVLDKSIGSESDYAESWEVVDHHSENSRVAAGPLGGSSLNEIVGRFGAELFGSQPPLARFPLLFKFLDANAPLSVQVHPNDAQAARLSPSDAGKTEAWIILTAEPGSVIYAGLKRGFGRAALEREIARGTVELCLNRFEPKAGDCILLPAGTLHAIGAGLLIAEIQQSSDTTYRLFDWNRVGPDGNPRPLHVREALDVIDFERGPIAPTVPMPTDRQYVTRLTACDKFVVDRCEIALPREIAGDGRFHILSVIEGSVTVDGDPSGRPLPMGETILLPAAAGPVRFEPTPPKAVLLDIYLP
ncbi:MAG TPA: type I phosphomannose isomerase catalytic subunit [Pirellulales bacterium]|nr:type I phosphomannose isomerase catalytic subunit [Pirellulales bacterium]